MGRPAAARAAFIAREGWAQDWPEPPTQSPVKYYTPGLIPSQVNDFMACKAEATFLSLSPV